MQQIDLLKRKLQRERDARRQAESLLEEKSLELFRTNQALEQRAAQAEAANRELEIFSYSVSHDLRSPLRSIDGFSRALLEDCLDQLSEDGRSYLSRICAATQRMAQLIDDLLSLGRVSRTDIRRQQVNLTRMSRDILNELRTIEPGREAECCVADSLAVEADPQLIHVVMDNLLRNAWKFTANRRLAEIEVGTSLEGGARVLFVRDNGAGFDMAYSAKLFGPFQRLHAASEFKGTGIGLATVQRIIHRHEGKIWARAAVNQGATFFFTLGS